MPRFYSNAGGGPYVYGPSIFSGDARQGDEVVAAWAAVAGGFDTERFLGRDGVYDWGQGGAAMQQQRDRMVRQGRRDTSNAA